MLNDTRVSFLSVPREDGSVPVNPLPSQYVSSSSGQFRNASSGTTPVSAQKLQFSCTALVSPDRNHGNDPVIGFLPSLSVLRLTEWLRLRGISPDRKLPWSESSVSEVML